MALVNIGQKRGWEEVNGGVVVTELQHSGAENIQSDIHTSSSSDETLSTNMVAVIFSSIPANLRSSESSINPLKKENIKMMMVARTKTRESPRPGCGNN